MTRVAGHLSPMLVRREQRHRRAVLLGLAALILLGVSPVVGHHVIGGVDWLPATVEHIGVFCAVALHQLLSPVHGLFHLLLAAGLAYATYDRWRATAGLRRTIGSLTATMPDGASPLAEASRRGGLDATRVRVVKGLPNPAFTLGWWRPLVFVAADLPARLAPDELAAVLAHEAAHVRRRDPLRLFVLRYFSGVLFWLPALRRLAADLADEAEIAADDAAARIHALPLASALLAIAGGDIGSGGLEPSTGFQHRDLLERRIRRLAGEDAVVGTHVSTRSIAGAAAALLLVWSSGVIVLHPLPAPVDARADGVHCTHAGAFPLSHLFCKGMRALAREKRCPHEAVAASPSA